MMLKQPKMPQMQLGKRTNTLATLKYIKSSSALKQETSRKRRAPTENYTVNIVSAEKTSQHFSFLI